MGKSTMYVSMAPLIHPRGFPEAEMIMPRLKAEKLQAYVSLTYWSTLPALMSSPHRLSSKNSAPRSRNPRKGTRGESGRTSSTGVSRLPSAVSTNSRASSRKPKIERNFERIPTKNMTILPTISQMKEKMVPIKPKVSGKFSVRNHKAQATKISVPMSRPPVYRNCRFAMRSRRYLIDRSASEHIRCNCSDK